MESGFSVGFCINEEKVICYQLELGKYLADVLTECSSRHQGESESVFCFIQIAFSQTFQLSEHPLVPVCSDIN